MMSKTSRSPTPIFSLHAWSQKSGIMTSRMSKNLDVILGQMSPIPTKRKKQGFCPAFLMAHSVLSQMYIPEVFDNYLTGHSQRISQCYDEKNVSLSHYFSIFIMRESIKPQYRLLSLGKSLLRIESYFFFLVLNGPKLVIPSTCSNS